MAVSFLYKILLIIADKRKWVKTDKETVNNLMHRPFLGSLANQGRLMICSKHLQKQAPSLRHLEPQNSNELTTEWEQNQTQYLSDKTQAKITISTVRSRALRLHTAMAMHLPRSAGPKSLGRIQTQPALAAALFTQGNLPARTMRSRAGIPTWALLRGQQRLQARSQIRG